MTTETLKRYIDCAYKVYETQSVRESGEDAERAAYHAMHVNFLYHQGSPSGIAMFEKYLRYRAAGHSHEKANELCQGSYKEDHNHIEDGA